MLPQVFWDLVGPDLTILTLITLLFRRCVRVAVLNK